MKLDSVSPDVVDRLFPSGSRQANKYVDLLAGEGVKRGLLGPRETPRLWSRHVLNCAVVAPLFAEGAAVADLGSGAGLPGIVLAIARPDLHMTLIEPLLRRATFLSEVVDHLSLPALVVRARAEDLHGRQYFDYVTARAVAPLDRLAEWAIPLCAPQGELVAWKGAAAADEVAAARVALQKRGARSVQIEHYGMGVVTPLATVVRIQSPA